MEASVRHQDIDASGVSGFECRIYRHIEMEMDTVRRRTLTTVPMFNLIAWNEFGGSKQKREAVSRVCVCVCVRPWYQRQNRTGCIWVYRGRAR